VEAETTILKKKTAKKRLQIQILNTFLCFGLIFDTQTQLQKIACFWNSNAAQHF